MSTSSIAGLATGASGIGSGNLLQITGLASNLDTTSIINALMALDRAPLTNLTNQQKALQTRNTQLTSIQTALQTVAMNAQALGSPGLYATSQTATSSDTTRVAATSTAGARVGGYQVAVTQLANSSYRTFAFTSPAADETFSIDGGGPVTVKAGSSVTDFVNADQLRRQPEGVRGRRWLRQGRSLLARHRRAERGPTSRSTPHRRRSRTQAMTVPGRMRSTASTAAPRRTPRRTRSLTRCPASP